MKWDNIANLVSLDASLVNFVFSNEVSSDLRPVMLLVDENGEKSGVCLFVDEELSIDSMHSIDSETSKILSELHCSAVPSINLRTFSSDRAKVFGLTS